MICAETKICAIEALREFSARVFIHFGCPKEDAEQAADVLACADLRGIDSHGIARLHSYFEMLSAGGVNPKPNIKIVRSTLSTATVNGDNGLGLVVGPIASYVKGELRRSKKQAGQYTGPGSRTLEQAFQIMIVVLVQTANGDPVTCHPPGAKLKLREEIYLS